MQNEIGNVGFFNCCNLVCGKKEKCQRFTYNFLKDRTYFNREYKENCDFYIGK